MVSLRSFASPTISALINLLAILFLVSNLLQNHVLLHDRAVQQSVQAEVSDLPSPERKRLGASTSSDGDYRGPISFAIPRGKAVARPAARLSDEEDSKIKRAHYGGKGDKPHLGGFTEFDNQGISPKLWSHMITHLGIKSLLDVGCGKGVSTSWFVLHGLEFVQCVEGSHDAVSQSIVPKAEGYERVVEHDFSLGPWWPDRTVDAVWCVEFTEHVGRNFQPNYLTAFRSAALIFVTHSNWGGWHHVEVHDDEWWRIRWEAAGLVYSDLLTASARSIAMKDRRSNIGGMETNTAGQHIWLSVQVYINPMVASLPEHAHLFAEHGCFGGKNEIGGKIHVDCHDKKTARGENLTPLPDDFKPLQLDETMDEAWLKLLAENNVGAKKEAEK